MAQQNPTFSVQEFELRGYTNPYLTAAQKEAVNQTESRVDTQLNFLAQMLGWNGPNYWDNLPVTVNQKRQLLGGTYGVYNSYVIPRIYEIRNWDNTLVVDRLPFVSPGRQTAVSRIVLGDRVFQLQSVSEEGDKYVISIGNLDQDFFDAIAAGEPLKVDIPTYRPAPFSRPNIGISGDFSFICGTSGTSLVLYPAYDTQRQFSVRFPILFAGSVYYFDQPIYLSLDSSLTPEVTPTFDAERNLWFFQIPGELSKSAGITAYLAWGNSNSVQANNTSLKVSLQPWTDPSDWKSISVLDNFKGVWNNKGGDLPYNFVFDALSIHGFSERDSLSFPELSRTLDFNEIVNFVYYQKIVVSELSPPGAKVGDLWWNEQSGALSVWLPDQTGCEGWVEIDYRQSPTQAPPPTIVYATVAAWQAALPSIPDSAIVRIDDVSGLQVSDNVIGVQGTLTAPGRLTLHKEIGTPFWVPDQFVYLTVTNFQTDASLLPYKVPVLVRNANGLAPSVSGNYTIENLKVTIAGEYSVILQKFYTNTTWELYPDSLLKYIANTALFNRLYQGQMWWDFGNSNIDSRAADIYYSSPAGLITVDLKLPGVQLPDGVYTNVDTIALSGTGGRAQLDITISGGVVTAYSVSSPGDFYQLDDLIGPDPATFPSLVGCTFVVTSTVGQDWVDVNGHSSSASPAPVLDLGTVLFYCNGDLLQSNIPYVTDDFIFTYTSNAATGKYEYTYTPRTFVGKTQFPTITISDALTTAYRADISNLVFSGISYYMSPNVYNAESPLRIWKAQALQVVNTSDLLAQDNYSNPLLADINSGPGPENWEKYFVRLPLEYGRNEDVWQKVTLTCQNLGYWGSTIYPEQMRCPPESSLPKIYEELFLYNQPVPDYTYVYAEPYLYSNVATFYSGDNGLSGAEIFPASDVQFDEFDETVLITYEPLHDRQADVTSPVGAGYGDWLGDYVNVNPCVELTGFLTTDLVNDGVSPVEPPVWDASIYKFPPTCQNRPESYAVDANHYKVGYAYFVADASCAEDSFFDIQQEVAWRYPETQPKTGYLLPR